MPDTALHAQLNPAHGNGVVVLRRVDAGLRSHYYVVPNQGYSGRARWVDVLTSDTDNNKETSIRAQLATA